MPIRNSHWYSINEGIAYPVDDAATCVDNDENRLPSNIITDLYLRWPETLGRYAFLSSLSVTARIVSLTIQCADSLDVSTGFTPLAVLSVVKPLVAGRQYALLPQADGVGGWIVFGAGADEEVPYFGRFRAQRQSFFTARAARAYRPLPVTGIRAQNSGRFLQGIVKLRANDPLQIVKEQREIDNVLRDVIVVRLVDGSGIDGFPVPDVARDITGYKEQSVYRIFAGPCAGRPESNTCGEPVPIEFINSVGPDCNGQITLEFKGCADVAKIADTCGIVVDCGLGLVDACVPPALPNSEGVLPSEYDPVNVPIPPDIPEPPDPVGLSESVVVIGGLPYITCFQDGDFADFETKLGLWQTVTDGTDLYKPSCDAVSVSDSYSASFSLSDTVPEYVVATNTAASRNVLVWNGFDESTLGRIFKTNVCMKQGPVGAKHNAGLVVNYRQHTSISGQFVYYIAELDYDNQQVRISRFNGTTFQTAVSLSVPGIVLDKWYEIEVTTTPTSGVGVNVTAKFTSLVDSSLDVTLGPLQVNNFLPSSGNAGFGTNRAVSRFSYFRVAAEQET